MKHIHLPPKRLFGLAFCAFLGLAGFQAEASEQTLLGIAVDNPVDGWNVMPDSTVYGHGDGLTDIYNGGYQTYTRAGVMDALRRIYVHGDDYIEVTVHGMESASSARKFLADRYRMETGETAPDDTDWDHFTVSPSGAVTAYAARGRWFIMVVSYLEGNQGKELTAVFMEALNERAAKQEQNGE
ncbi:MAG: hypothetical protein P8Z37_00240 [Acidobacteriota bacterium]